MAEQKIEFLSQEQIMVSKSMASSDPPSLPCRRNSQIFNGTEDRPGPFSNQNSSHSLNTTVTARTSTNLHSSRDTKTPGPLHSRSDFRFDESPSISSSSREQRVGRLSMTENASSGLNQPRIRAFLEDYYDDLGTMATDSRSSWTLFFEKYCVPDFQWIRPTGNPIDQEGLIDMFLNDIRIHSGALVSLDSVVVLEGGKSAVALYTADQIFTYKGTENKDRTVISCVLELRNDEIKIVHEHRSAGKMIPKETRWSGVE